MDGPPNARTHVGRVVALVVASTLVLTTALLGAVAFATATASGAPTRLPYYVLGGAVLFVALVFQFERRAFDGRTVILASGGLAVVGTGLLVLVGEGAAYVAAHPNRVFSSQPVLYLLAVGVCCTGLAHWGLNHWREFVTT